MKRFILIFIILPIVTWSQEESTMETKFKLGETTIGIYEKKSSEADDIIFVNVHEDETTSIETLFRYSELDSLQFFYLRHLWTRRIQFKLDDVSYDFDPNRIFTKKGRKKTLKDGGNYSVKANKTVKKLAKEIISRIPEAHIVVAVHNNTDVNYSIKSYSEGGDEFANTGKLYINPEMDADDFIYTTDLAFFEAFEARGINVILQDDKTYVNDGSLSVYCGKKGIRYINIETQKGHFDGQMELMKVVLEIIRSE
jgi:hypothetical protein